jgi:hypothetical protein
MTEPALAVAVLLSVLVLGLVPAPTLVAALLMRLLVPVNFDYYPYAPSFFLNKFLF